MTQEQKELLLKDLCARLSYHPKIKIDWEDIGGSGTFDETLWTIDAEEYLINDRHIEDIKPYLRPMSSMTEEEAKEMCKTVFSYDKITSLQILSDRVRYGILYNGSFNHITFFFNKIYSLEQVDWLLAHHIDFRGLIPMGLAIAVTKENNPYN